MLDSRIKKLVQDCEMQIVGHKIFVRMKDIPMYLSKKTRDSIRNRYSHSIEVGLSTEYILDALSCNLEHFVNLNFYNLGKIVGLVHDIGHTAFSHSGEVILDNALKKASRALGVEIRFDANINNFRRIEKYRLFAPLPKRVKKYALASLLKRPNELKKYPEYLYLQEYLKEAIAIEEDYLNKNGIKFKNRVGKTVLNQAMDLADENRYRVTDIIDSLNIYSKVELSEILQEMIKSEVTLKEISKYAYIDKDIYKTLLDKKVKNITIKELLITLLHKESHAKTEFQNLMNSISMAFNRNVYLKEDGAVEFINANIEALREDFKKIGAKYIWGSKKVQRIRNQYIHYFKDVVNYFLFNNYNIDFIDSTTYANALKSLKSKNLNPKEKRVKELMLLRNFLGGLTNPKIMQLYKLIELEKFEKKYGLKIQDKKRDKLIHKTSIKEFKKSLDKYKDSLKVFV